MHDIHKYNVKIIGSDSKPVAVLFISLLYIDPHYIEAAVYIVGPYTLGSHRD